MAKHISETVDMSRRCLTCKHWEGDRDAQWLSIQNIFDIDVDVEAAKRCASLEEGWLGSGGCGEQGTFLEVDVIAGWNGGYSEVTFSASFGCILWKDMKDTE